MLRSCFVDEAPDTTRDAIITTLKWDSMVGSLLPIHYISPFRGYCGFVLETGISSFSLNRNQVRYPPEVRLHETFKSY